MRSLLIRASPASLPYRTMRQVIVNNIFKISINCKFPFSRIVGRFIPDSELFQVLKIRLADESDVNYLSSSLNKSLPFKPDNSYLDRSLPAPSTFEASYEEPEKTTTESYQHLQTTPAPVADTDYLFQPY